MQKIDILFAHEKPDTLVSLRDCIKRLGALQIHGACSCTEAEQVLEKTNSIGLALISHTLPGSTLQPLVRRFAGRGVPVLALVAGPAQEEELSTALSDIPSFIGASTTENPEVLASIIDRLWRNRRLKTLSWARSDSFRKQMHTNLQRCMFKAHSPKDSGQILTILQNNPDVALLVLAAEEKADVELLLEITRQARTRTPYQTLGIFCLLDETVKSYGIKLLAAGADSYVLLPCAPRELQLRCTTLAGKVEYVRQLNIRNERKNRLVAMVAHELRNPLQAVQNHVKTLLAPENGPLSAEQRAVLNTVSRINVESLQTVNNALDMSAIEQGKIALNLKPERLDMLAAERLRLATQIAWGKSLRIRRILSEVTCPIDRARMAQVIDNLVTNAIKYTPPGKDVILKVVKTANEAVLSVTNQGEGIPPEERAHLFKPYYIGSAGRNGQDGGPAHLSRGLGLAITAQMVAGHKGRIWVESKLGEETTFFIALPLNGCAAVEETA